MSNHAFVFFNDTATTEIYTLSLHDALPIWTTRSPTQASSSRPPLSITRMLPGGPDRKSTRLNSSHRTISYAVFCLKKKKLNIRRIARHRCSFLSAGRSESDIG